MQTITQQVPEYVPSACPFAGSIEKLLNAKNVRITIKTLENVKSKKNKQERKNIEWRVSCYTVAQMLRRK